MENYKTFKDITPEIKFLRQLVFVEEQKIPYELEIEKDEGKYLHFCLYEDDLLVAYARGKVEDSIAHIGRVCVFKNKRGLGYGKKIMSYTEMYFSLFKVEEFQLNAQIHAQEFYEKLGYHILGKTFMEAGILHISMRKKTKK